MFDRPTGRMPWLSGAILCAGIALSGCHTPSLPSSLTQGSASEHASRSNKSKSAEKKIEPVRPGTELEWAIQTSTPQAGLVPAGRSLVGPDGTMAIGPYGTFKVAGLTIPEATKQVEKQLAAFVKQPHLSLRTTPTTVPAQDLVWRKADDPANPALAADFHSTLQKDTRVQAAGFQTPLPAKVEVEPPTGRDTKDAAGAAASTGSPPVTKVTSHFRAHQPAQPILPPHGPSEMSPVILATYTIRPPDVLLIESQKGLLTQPIRGQHLVRPDGTVGVGIYGPVLVSGKTIADARVEIARVIHARLDPKQVKLEDVLDGLSVDVLAFNSSVYYIITDGAGLGQQVYRFPVMGNETVLDAISNINGLPVVSSPKRIWLARRAAANGEPYNIYPVDWHGITQQGAMDTNWQIMPGDRVYVQSDPMRRFNNSLSKFLEPIERVLGVTLLGGQAVNAVRGRVP